MNGRTTPSGIQRYIKNRFLDLCIAIQYTAHAPISCSQFWRIFGELDWASWNAVNELFFGITIDIRLWTEEIRELGNSINPYFLVFYKK